MTKLAVHVRPSLRGGLLAAAAAGLLAAAPTAADAAGWIEGPRFDVSTASTSVDVAAAPDGSAVAAWSNLGNETFSDKAAVRVQHATAAQVVSPAVDLGIPADTPAGKQAEVAVGAGGAAAVVWYGRVAAAGPDRARLTLLRADGTVVTTLEIAPDLDSGLPTVAVDGDGDALLVWSGTGGVVQVQRVSATGAIRPPEPLNGGSGGAPQVAITPGGVGWVLWDDARRVTRVAADGSLDGSAVLPPAGSYELPAIAAGENSGAVARFVTADGRMHIDGMRLQTSDDVFGAPFATPALLLPDTPMMPSLTPAVAPDGSITLAWADGVRNEHPSDSRLWIDTARFGGTAATTDVRRLPASGLGGPLGDLVPVLAQRPGGDDTLLAAGAVGRSGKGTVTATTIGADGIGVAPASTGLFLPGPFLVGLGGVVKPFATADGGALVATVVPGTEATFASLQTRRHDAAPPQLTAQIPTAAETGRAAAFSASASDLLGDTTVWWDFGDGNGARGGPVSHVYTAPGTYTVTVTAEDESDNVATVARQVTVPAPPGPQQPPTKGVPTPGPDTRRAAAELKLTRAVRSGARVTIAGTIARGATGTVRLVYAQKSGRRTLTASTSARVANGRFAATIRLGRALAKRFKLKPVVTAVYAGDAKTAAARTARTVTVRAARRGAKKKR